MKSTMDLLDKALAQHPAPYWHERLKLNRSALLYGERRQIESRYERGQWHDVPTVNNDQARERFLRQQLRRNNCPMQ